MTLAPGEGRWAEALRAASLLAADPQACVGIRLRAGPGPVREAWLRHLTDRLAPGTPVRRCPPGIGDDRLLGGLDLAATLSAGRPVAQAGLLAEADGGLVVVPMAERLSPGTAARLAAALDTGTITVARDGFCETRPARFGLVLLDEGLDDEAPPSALTERLAFDVDLRAFGLREIEDAPPGHDAADLRGLRRARSAERHSSGTAFASAHPERRSQEPLFPPPSAGEGGPRSGSGEGSDASGQRAPLSRPSLTRGPPSPAPKSGLPDLGTQGADLGQARDPSGGGKARGLFGREEEVGRGATAPDRSRPTPEPDDASDAIPALCAAADALGVTSLRGPLLAVRIARLIAARDGRDGLAERDLVEAAALVLGPRATRMPVPEQPAEASEPPPDDRGSPQEENPPEPDGDAAGSEQQAESPNLDDVVLAAARAAIPPGMLAALAAGQAPARGGKAGRAGAAASAARQGRPIGTRPGDPRRGRLALLATLRAAAPWQALRRSEAEAGDARAILVRPEDFRITRFRQRTESTTIFAVDASGSAAIERLAEAKGAVELLLAEAYVRRDRVALVAFRGRAAELVLPPTRSLVRAKRELAELPGGGGTPLAAGLDAAADVALAVRRGGGTPVVVLLTDGRANVDRAGAPGRPRAAEDALAAARRFRAAAFSAILIDTAPRPQDSARALAEAMGARYLPLPQADARKLSAAVRAAGAAA
ncbi:VWA domain-containing protein [Methylobacterium sp. E-041]|nr:VWA domain-containing protein [Methylobacterium sp. E-041]MCJ2105486.1 VWA domain-containing protein [Methylobacterium sp. E-041]